MPVDEAIDIASDPSTSEEILAELASYPNDIVLLAIKHNPSTPPRILELPSIAKIEDATYNFYVDCYCENAAYTTTGDIIKNLEPVIQKAVISNDGVFEGLDVIIEDDSSVVNIFENLITIAVTFGIIESSDESETIIGEAILGILDHVGFDIHFAEFG